MSDTEIQSAMTAGEWETWRQEGHVTRNDHMILHSKGIGFAGVPRISAYMVPMDTETHACAAACLYGHPFGFTQDDVEWIDSEIADDERRWTPESVAWLKSLRARIAALLPPTDHL